MPISDKNYAAIKAVHEWTIEDYESELSLLRRKRDELLEALREISKGEGAFSLDHKQHAINTIDSMKRIANAAISNCTPSPALDSGAGQTSGPAPEGLARTIFDYWCASPFSPVSKPDREMSWGMRDTRESFMHLARRERRLLRDAMLHGAFECWLETCKGNSYTDYIRPRLVAKFPDVTDEPIPVPEDESEIHTDLNERANGI